MIEFLIYALPPMLSLQKMKTTMHIYLFILKLNSLSMTHMVPSIIASLIPSENISVVVGLRVVSVESCRVLPNNNVREDRCSVCIPDGEDDGIEYTSEFLDDPLEEHRNPIRGVFESAAPEGAKNEDTGAVAGTSREDCADFLVRHLLDLRCEGGYRNLSFIPLKNSFLEVERASSDYIEFEALIGVEEAEPFIFAISYVRNVFCVNALKVLHWVEVVLEGSREGGAHEQGLFKRR